MENRQESEERIITERAILLWELQASKFPSVIIRHHVNAMAEQLYPIKDYATKVWVQSDNLMIRMIA